VSLVLAQNGSGDPPPAPLAPDPTVKTPSKGTSSILSGPIEKPPGDDKEYRGLTLPNGLKVLLVRDANATKAAASLTVGAGQSLAWK
jgi:insulysin